MESERKYLDGSYLAANPTFHVEDSPWKAGQIAKMWERHHLSPQSVCEVGCGAGEILHQLQLRYPQVELLHGYEISPQGYALALQRQNEKLEFFNGDLLRAQQVHYDLMLCIDVFEHVENYFDFLRNIRSYADHFIFHIPLDMNVQMIWRAAPIDRVRREVGHLHYFSKETAFATLSDTGYVIKDWFYTPGGSERPQSVKAKLAALPRQLATRISPDLTVRILGGYSLLVYASPAAI